MDVDSGAIVAGRSVVVSDGCIKEIGTQESVRATAGARVIDGSGRYLIPALWDMHTHPMEPEALSMLVANGVGGNAFRHRGRVKWLSNFTEADFEQATRADDKQGVLLRAMHAAGVPRSTPCWRS